MTSEDRTGKNNNKKTRLDSYIEKKNTKERNKETQKTTKHAMPAQYNVSKTND